jgi:chaperone required for assembly of F1-ATPase
VKRFWNEARAEHGQVLLDGRPVRTPKRSLLELPHPELAAAIAREWNGVGEVLDPRALPLTGLANAAIDIVAADRTAFGENLARYAETDLLAYRATSPDALIARQSREWDPLLDWVRTRYDVHVEVVGGIMHRPQPDATVARLRTSAGGGACALRLRACRLVADRHHRRVAGGRACDDRAGLLVRTALVSGQP